MIVVVKLVPDLHLVSKPVYSIRMEGTLEARLLDSNRNRIPISSNSNPIHVGVAALTDELTI